MDEPIVKGRFSLYATPNGGLHLAFLLEGDDHEETRHMDFPPAMIRMAKMAGIAGDPMALLRGFAGGNRE